MDPFVVIEHKGVKYKTCVIQGGGKKPIWNDTFEIPVPNLDDKLKVYCYDEDVFNHDLVGEAMVTISLLCTLQPSRKWLPLKYGKTKSGMILLETKYTPPLDRWP
jgi:Ca2+-dependent lipid-binding protein